MTCYIIMTRGMISLIVCCIKRARVDSVYGRNVIVLPANIGPHVVKKSNRLSRL